ncbi:S-adenosyl-L-methionine-dependent methyltransferase [Gongronella butleri]|nr:S-adenosyl-L-methionine-dependent methyltransferase [Gongronella butleri]
MKTIHDLVKAPFLDFIANLIDTEFPGHPSSIRVLDAGCGSGHFCKLLKARYGDKVNVTGIEPFDDILEAQKEPQGIEFLQDTFLGYADKVELGSFDMIIFTKSLHHCEENPSVTVDRARQLLAPKGLFVAEELWTHDIDEHAASHRWFFDRVDLMFALNPSLALSAIRPEYEPARDKTVPVEERWRAILSTCRDHSSEVCKQAILDVFGSENTTITTNVPQLREWWPNFIKDDDAGYATLNELMSQEYQAVVNKEILGIGILFVARNRVQAK